MKMEKILIQVEDKKKTKQLLEFLKALDFVNSIRTSRKEIELKKDYTISEDSFDFFSLLGLWKDRDIDLEAIRKKAFPRQNL